MVHYAAYWLQPLLWLEFYNTSISLFRWVIKTCYIYILKLAIKKISQASISGVWADILIPLDCKDDDGVTIALY